MKTERDDDGALSNDFKTEGANAFEEVNLKDDGLEEKKEILVNGDHLVVSSSLSLSSSSSSSSFSSSSSSSTTNNNATERKTTNRIVVSNARISNNSVTVSVIYPENDSPCFPLSNGGTLSSKRTGKKTRTRRVRVQLEATIDKFVFSADVSSNEVQQQSAPPRSKENWMNSRKQAGASVGEEAVTGFGYHDVGPRSNETNTSKT